MEVLWAYGLVGPYDLQLDCCPGWSLTAVGDGQDSCPILLPLILDLETQTVLDDSLKSSQRTGR